MKLDYIDKGKEFDFGRTSDGYARYRDIYPKSMYEKLMSFGIGKRGQIILDLGSGTAVLPINMSASGAEFTATDISENQVRYGKKLVKEKGLTNISFKVCSAEDTGFDDNSFDVVTAVQCFHYFDAEKAAEEIRRVLKSNGIFCKVFMDWMPFEDEKIAEMEATVLKYNPTWNGKGFREYKYALPSWAVGRFEIKNVMSYDTVLEFSKEQWLGRIMSCRGVGASLSEEKIAEFENEYREILAKYDEPLRLKHQIHIEVYEAL
ncbi:MAG: class I SAM-dependent methyltransferase [Ruminococcus sp.]|nr:class I SAM-dependent methyltransferase [Ruminococcus sp.]